MTSWLTAQESLLQAGPMVGYSDYREALIWVQTTEAANVHISYWTGEEAALKTESMATTAASDFIVKLFPDNLIYGKTYNYTLFINGKEVQRDYELSFKSQPLWQFREDPPAFKFAIGSCSFINDPVDDRPQPYGDGYEIFNKILEKDPDMMLWLGDNIYLRTPDFLTESGIRHRHRHTRATRELQPLLGSVHHYATWDDHDYGPNDSDGSYVNKKITEKVFNDYWGNLNTDAAQIGGITSHFPYHDVEFFMMDNRYHRDPNRQITSDKAYLGDAQLEWLINALTASSASFKIVVVGGQTISSAAVYENYATYPEERERLLKRLHEERIEGVLFMSGDRHHTEISKLERKDAYPLIDITCSPLTSGTHQPRDEGNTLQVEGTTFYDRNFGVVEVSGKFRERTLLLTIYDALGKKIYDYTVKQKDLQYPKD